MTITAQRLLTELGCRAWSGFNEDDMVFDNEDASQAKSELNCNLRYLINREDFPFRKTEQDLLVIRNMASYSVPQGQITKIYYADSLEELIFIGDNTIYDKNLKGRPANFWVNSANPDQNIILYPIPDNKYNLKVVYNQYMPIMDNEGNYKFEFESADDFINMPENLAYMFMDCLVMRTMVTNNKDDQDENYAPMRKEFEEMWRVFIKACKPVKVQNMVIW